MNKQMILKLNNLNKNFYQTTAEDFDDSRQFYWQGWESLLPTILQIKPQGKLNVLDIGCGNARFAKFLSENLGGEFEYTGIDNSKELLLKADETCKNLKIATCNFQQLDIVQELLIDSLAENLDQNYDLIVLFGVMHHIPSFELRAKLIKVFSEKLSSNGILVFTSWQFANQERFQDRIISPAVLESEEDELEKNDYILDWRRGAKAYRYCHHLDEEEIAKIIAEIPNLQITEQFYADGKTGDLNLYTICQNAQK